MVRYSLRTLPLNFPLSPNPFFTFHYRQILFLLHPPKWMAINAADWGGKGEGRVPGNFPKGDHTQSDHKHTIPPSLHFSFRKCMLDDTGDWQKLVITNFHVFFNFFLFVSAVASRAGDNCGLWLVFWEENWFQCIYLYIVIRLCLLCDSD